MIYLESIYLEYEILTNRPGLLGDLASFFGLLNINISTIASIDDEYRGLLLEMPNQEMTDILKSSLSNVEELVITSLRKPRFVDLLALKHGRKILEGNEKDYYKFKRDNLHLLIDFVSEYIRRHDDALIGFKGSPRVGKTETAIATAVHANKHWKLLSSTLLRKVARTRIADDSLNSETVFIIDAITTFHRSTAKHVQFIRNKIIPLKLPKIIEHPEVFIKETKVKREEFDMIVEIEDGRESKKPFDDYLRSFNSFDIS